MATLKFSLHLRYDRLSLYHLLPTPKCILGMSLSRILPPVTLFEDASYYWKVIEQTTQRAVASKYGSHHRKTAQYACDHTIGVGGCLGDSACDCVFRMFKMNASIF